MTFPINAVRSQFLPPTDEGQRRIYFDNAAGTQVPKRTINRIVDSSIDSTATGVFNPTSVEVDALYAGTQGHGRFSGHG